MQQHELPGRGKDAVAPASWEREGAVALVSWGREGAAAPTSWEREGATPAGQDERFLLLLPQTTGIPGIHRMWHLVRTTIGMSGKFSKGTSRPCHSCLWNPRGILLGSEGLTSLRERKRGFSPGNRFC